MTTYAHEVHHRGSETLVLHVAQDEHSSGLIGVRHIGYSVVGHPLPETESGLVISVATPIDIQAPVLPVGPADHTIEHDLLHQPSDTERLAQYIRSLGKVTRLAFMIRVEAGQLPNDAASLEFEAMNRFGIAFTRSLAGTPALKPEQVPGQYL